MRIHKENFKINNKKLKKRKWFENQKNRYWMRTKI